MNSLKNENEITTPILIIYTRKASTSVLLKNF